MKARQKKQRRAPASNPVMKQTAILASLLVTLSVTGAVAADWPWLYGPRHDGTSDQNRRIRTEVVR